TETAKLEAPKVEGSDLYFRKTKASNDLVDAIAKKHGGVATVFVKSGDQYTRVATTVKKEDSTSAVGTALDANSPALTMAKRITEMRRSSARLTMPDTSRLRTHLA